MSCVEFVNPPPRPEQSIDRSALAKAFRIAVHNYNPYRRGSDPSQDSFWQIISGARKLDLLTESFHQLHGVNENIVSDWENRRALPDQRQRGKIAAGLKAATAQLL